MKTPAKNTTVYIRFHGGIIDGGLHRLKFPGKTPALIVVASPWSITIYQRSGCVDVMNNDNGSAVIEHYISNRAVDRHVA